MPENSAGGPTPHMSFNWFPGLSGTGWILVGMLASCLATGFGLGLLAGGTWA